MASSDSPLFAIRYSLFASDRSSDVSRFYEGGSPSPLEVGGGHVNGKKCSFLGTFPGDLESRNTSITVNSKFLDDKHMGFAGVLDEVAIFS